MARTISDRDAAAKAYAIVDEIETRAERYLAAGMSMNEAFDKAMGEMAR
jgi:hypothetical protein